MTALVNLPWCDRSWTGHRQFFRNHHDVNVREEKLIESVVQNHLFFSINKMQRINHEW